MRPAIIVLFFAVFVGIAFAQMGKEPAVLVDKPGKAVMTMKTGSVRTVQLISLTTEEVKFKSGTSDQSLSYLARDDVVKSVETTDHGSFAYNPETKRFAVYNAKTATFLDTPVLVVAEGVGATEAEALENAQRKAAAQVVASLVKDPDLKNNEQLISELLNSTNPYVGKPEEMLKTQEKGSIRLKARVSVSPGTLAAKLKALDIPMKPFEWKAEPGPAKPGSLAGRLGALKEQLLQQEGGTAESEAAVARGLAWLSAHQGTDGRWSLHKFPEAATCKCDGRGRDNDQAGTGLALLALLGAGETHKGKDKHTKNVERGLRWLLSKQAQDGQMGEGYAHAINTIALCEAYALSSDPWLKAPAQRAVNCTVAWQAPDGGFRYQPRIPGDTSVTAWHVQAVHAGELAGLKVPSKTLQSIDKYLDSVWDRKSNGYGYQDSNAVPTVTAAALLCRQYRGWKADNPSLLGGRDFLLKSPPSDKLPNIYYYYYATQVVHNLGGEPWDKWNVAIRDSLIAKQDDGKGKTPHQKGSWSITGDAWPQHGRLGYTCMAIMTLEVYYRHAPLYPRK